MFYECTQTLTVGSTTFFTQGNTYQGTPTMVNGQQVIDFVEDDVANNHRVTPDNNGVNWLQYFTLVPGE
jgi:hypothetical protein